MPSRSAPRNGSAVSISSALISSRPSFDKRHALAVRQDRRLRLLVDHLDQRAEPHPDPGLGVGTRLLHGRRDAVAELAEDVDDRSTKQILLVAEVLVDQAHADPGPLGHRMGGRRVIAVLLEELHSRRQDLRPSALDPLVLRALGLCRHCFLALGLTR